MKSSILSISFILASLMVIGSYGDSVSIDGMCRYIMPTGAVIDLTNLPTPYTYKSQGSTYEYSPCDTVNCNGDQAAVCQQGTPSGDYEAVIGYASSTSLNYQWGVFNITYFGNSVQSTVTCKCSSDERLVFKGKSLPNNYLFELNSQCCCEDGCKSDPLGGFKTAIFTTTGGLIMVYLVLFFCMAKKSKRNPALSSLLVNQTQAN